MKGKVFFFHNRQLNACICIIVPVLEKKILNMITKSLQLTLLARDRGNPAASSETTLTIKILDVDDNDPKFPMKVRHEKCG